MRSDWLTTGPAISTFEGAVAAYCGARYAAAVSSGTAALHAACHALSLGGGDRVWTSPNSFVASANCALYCGAKVDFVDIDPRSYNLSATELERKLAVAEKAGTLPRAIVLVHFGGQPCDLTAISELARRYGIRIIEDASHALGATYWGDRIGSCRYSDATIFSFFATKSIATGEGGMVVTNSEEIARRVARFRNHGITREPQEMTADLDAEPWKYEQIDLGLNYRMTDIQATLGASQLMKLEVFIRRRRELAQRYDQGLSGLPLQLPYRDGASTSAWHLYAVQILGDRRSMLRRKLYSALREQGILSQVHYIPIHTQPYYRKLGSRIGDFPVAEHYYEGALSLPLFVDLAESDQDCVIEIARATLSAR